MSSVASSSLPVVGFAGPRSGPASSASSLVSSLVGSVLASGRGVASGCASGVDSLAVSAALAAAAGPRLSVFCAFGPSGLGALARSSAPPSSLVPVVASGGRVPGGPAALLVPVGPCPGRSLGWSVAPWPLCVRWPSPLPVPALSSLSPVRRPVVSPVRLPALGRSGRRAVPALGVRLVRRRCSVCLSLSFPSAGPLSRRRRCPCFPVRSGSGRRPLRRVPGPPAGAGAPSAALSLSGRRGCVALFLFRRFP